MPLSTEQVEALGERLIPLFQRLEYAVITDIARRLKDTGRLTETAELMAQSLQTKGFSPHSIHARVMKLLRADAKFQKAVAENTLLAKQALLAEIEKLRAQLPEEIAAVVDEAGETAFREDLSMWQGGRMPVKDSAFAQLVAVFQARATDEILNLTKSMGFKSANGTNIRAERAYTQALNMALTRVASGAYSYNRAVEDAVRDLARSGLRTVDFESGVTRQLDTAVRNAIMTTSSQISGEITLKNAKDTGVQLVEVSAHWGARTGSGHGNHAAWQGKIYCIEGSDGVHANLEEATGYPSDPKGLHGYNCRHSFYPFWEGISQPAQWPPEPGPREYNGKTYTYYQATQAQRSRERDIRALRREIYGYTEAGLTAKAAEAKSRLKSRIAEYNAFSAAMGISPKPARLRVATISK